MIITKERLNESYLRYCTNKTLDPLNENVTKEFMEYWMAKNNLTHVKDIGESFHFLKAHKQ